MFDTLAGNVKKWQHHLLISTKIKPKRNCIILVFAKKNNYIIKYKIQGSLKVLQTSRLKESTYTV